MKVLPKQRIKATNIKRKMVKVSYKEISKEMYVYTAETLVHESKFICGCKKQNKNYLHLHLFYCGFKSLNMLLPLPGMTSLPFSPGFLFISQLSSQLSLFPPPILMRVWPFFPICVSKISFQTFSIAFAMLYSRCLFTYLPLSLNMSYILISFA